jgi:hypothetical protein
VHFSARAILAAGVLACAVITGEQDLLGKADIEKLVHLFFVNPRRGEAVHRRLEDD